MDMVESKKIEHQRHWYPTRITQLSQEMNKVEQTSMTPYNTRHQQWLMNVHQ